MMVAPPPAMPMVAPPPAMPMVAPPPSIAPVMIAPPPPAEPVAVTLQPAPVPYVAEPVAYRAEEHEGGFLHRRHAAHMRGGTDAVAPVHVATAEGHWEMHHGHRHNRYVWVSN
jgi:hypothetical protein